jgi:hypothetical protein
VEGYYVDCLLPSLYIKASCAKREGQHAEKKSTPSPSQFMQLVELKYETHEEACCSSCQGLSHETCENVKPISDILPRIDIKKEFEKLKTQVG